MIYTKKQIGLNLESIDNKTETQSVEDKFIFSRLKKRRKPKSAENRPPKVKLVTLQLCEVKKSRYSFYEKLPTSAA